MTYPFPQATLAVITVVAVLHHLPLQAALTRFRQLLAPEGVLLIVGLYRPATVADYGWCAFGRIASLAMRCFKRMAPLEATTRSPKETLVEIRNCAKACLPGVSLRRRLLFRYTLIWRKPLDPR
jgi:SAM-dependent methyltransferase